MLLGIELDGSIPVLAHHTGDPVVVVRGDDERGPDSARVGEVGESADIDSHACVRLAERLEHAVGRRRGHEDAFLGVRAVLVDFEQAESRFAVVVLFSREAHERQPVDPLPDFFAVGQDETHLVVWRLDGREIEDAQGSAGQVVVK